MSQDPDPDAAVPSEIKERPSRRGLVPLRVPEPFGKYVLVQRIGAGGMAEVFQAIVSGPEGFQRSLVIKRMLPQLSLDEAFVRMFIDEAKLSGLLSHPNLVQIYEFGKVDESFFIAMEHVQGRTLAAMKARLAAADRLAPIAASVEIARQICAGLNYAHALQGPDGRPLGIVHRDISPPNIMLDFHGLVKIVDFGIARVAEGLRETRTQVGVMKGKIAYMSPEQLQLGEIDQRSDIFAVGIVLHELLTGRRLFRSNTDYASSKMVLEMVIPEPSSLNAAVPAELDRVVMRALQRDPAARYPTAGEMAADLEHVMMDLRFSPREHLKLLRDLFPEAEGTEKGMSVTGTFSAPREEVASGEKPTSHVSHADLSRGSGGGMTGPTPTPGSSPSPSPSPSPSSVSTVSAATTRSGRVVDGGPTGDPRAATSRKTILTTVAIVTAVALAAVPLLLRLRGDDAAHIEATTMTVRRVEVLPTSVRLSLDSNPQDAEVIQVDSGRVLGRTPFTTSLPRATNVIVFRVEKVGHAPALYKIIPDLDKTVRVDLIPIPVALPSPAPARSAPPAPVATRAPAGKRERGARSSAAAAAKTARVHAATSKDCSVTIGSLPWAELWIDGKDVGQPTPVVHLPVTCGHHKVRFKRDNPEIDHVESITVTAGQEFKQNFKLASADSDG